MRLNTLRVKDFKSIKEIYLDSFKRINCIAGTNGSGKSALLSALAYVLTNDLEDKIEEYVRWGSDKFEIEMNFNHEQHNYKFEIEGTKSAKKRLVIDDKDEYINSEASKKLAEIIDPIITKYSAISEQGKTTTLLFQKPAERLKTIKEILKIDSIFKAVENIKEDAKLIKADIDKIETEQNVLKARTYSFLDEDELKKQVEADANIDELLKIEEQSKLTYEKGLKDQEQYNKDLDAYTKAEKSKVEYTAITVDLVDKIGSLAKEKLPVVEFDSFILDTLNAEYKECEHKKIKYDADIESWNTAQLEIKNIEESLKTVNDSVNQIVVYRLPACKYNDQTIEEVQLQINNLNVELASYLKMKDLAKSGKCPTCNQDYTLASLSDIEEKISVTKTLIENAISVKEDQKKEISEYNKDQEKNKENIAIRNSLLEKKKFYEDQLSKYISAVKPEEVDSILFDSITLKIKEQEELKSSIDKEIEHNRNITAQITTLQDKISFYQKELGKIVSIEKPIEPVIQVKTFDSAYYDSLKKRSAVAEQKKAELQRAVEFNDTLKKEKKADDKKIDANDKLREANLKELNILNETRSILEKDFSSFLVDKSVVFIRDQMNKFFQQTYNKYEITIEQDKNSVSFFYSDGTKQTPCSMASGAEKDILAIANRVALCSLQDLGIMILDEADSHMSAENSINLFQQLTNQKNINQLFVITHCNETKEFFESMSDCEVFEICNGELV